MALGLNSTTKDLVGGFIASRVLREESDLQLDTQQPNVSKFMKALEQNGSPVIQVPSVEKDSYELKLEARENSRGVFDEVGTPKHEDILAYMSGNKVVGGNRAGNDEDEQKAKEEQRKKEENTRQYMQQLTQLGQTLQNYQSQYAQTQVDLANLRQEIRLAEERSKVAAVKVEEATQTYEEKSAETKTFQEEMEGKTVTINGKEIVMEGGVLVDKNDPNHNTNPITKEELAGSDDPMAKKMLKYLEDQEAKVKASYTQGGYSRVQSDSDKVVEEKKEEVVKTEQKAQELEEKIEDTQGQIQELKGQSADAGAAIDANSADATAPVVVASADIETGSARNKIDGTGQTGLMNEDTAPKASMRGEFKTKAEGVQPTPETPDISQDQNLSQTADLAAKNGPVLQQQFRPVGMA